MTYEDCLNRVKKINDDLVELDLTSEQIEIFWNDVFEQCEVFIKKEKINFQIKK